MYIRKTNNKTHKKYSIEEKNQIVLLYLDRHMGRDNLYKREIETVVNNFINYYNNERLQEKIKELTPIQ